MSQVLGGNVTECDLVARGVIGGKPVNYLFRVGDMMFVPTDGSAPLSDTAVRALAQTAGQEITYTCLPPGWGVRVLPPANSRPTHLAAK